MPAIAVLEPAMGYALNPHLLVRIVLAVGIVRDLGYDVMVPGSRVRQLGDVPGSSWRIYTPVSLVDQGGLDRASGQEVERMCSRLRGLTPAFARTPVIVFTLHQTGRGNELALDATYRYLALDGVGSIGSAPHRMREARAGAKAWLSSFDLASLLK